MSTYEDRLTTFEKTLALLQKRAGSSIDELNRNATMLLGMVSSQQMDIKEIKISQITVEERLDTMDQRLSRLETKFDEHIALLTQILERLPDKSS